jgi:hypothetical protein
MRPYTGDQVLDDIDIYAKDGQRVAPFSEAYNKGREMGDTLPAAWWNYLVNNYTLNQHRAKQSIDDIYAEVLNVLSQGGISPNENLRTQLRQAILNIYTQSANATSASLMQPIEAEITAARGGYATISARLIKDEQDVEDTQDMVTAQQKIVDALAGQGGWLNEYNFGTATPSQGTLTQHALTELGLSDPLTIYNGTKIQNTYDKHVWILDNYGTTFTWVDAGEWGVPHATSTLWGTVKLSNTAPPSSAVTGSPGTANGTVANADHAHPISPALLPIPPEAGIWIPGKDAAGKITWVQAASYGEPYEPNPLPAATRWQTVITPTLTQFLAGADGLNIYQHVIPAGEYEFTVEGATGSNLGGPGRGIELQIISSQFTGYGIPVGTPAIYLLGGGGGQGGPNNGHGKGGKVSLALTLTVEATLVILLGSTGGTRYIGADFMHGGGGGGWWNKLIAGSANATSSLPGNGANTGLITGSLDPSVYEALDVTVGPGGGGGTFADWTAAASAKAMQVRAPLVVRAAADTNRPYKGAPGNIGYLLRTLADPVLFGDSYYFGGGGGGLISDATSSTGGDLGGGTGGSSLSSGSYPYGFGGGGVGATAVLVPTAAPSSLWSGIRQSYSAETWDVADIPLPRVIIARLS